ncbi:MAG: hypothetical protein NC342_05070 [Pseudoflavonifractor sp.]|nr:hypothetical protein [Alloprevotella sp.]MCM1116890.1 hypothetical protein [Pseudoflavonifractor sp.]
MTIYTEGETPSTPTTPTEPEKPADKSSFKYSLASSIESGKTYALFACDTVATAITSNNGYGYLYGEAVTEEDGVFTASAAAGFTFDAVEGGYTIKDANGKYLYQTGNYNSFNLTEDPATEGSVWTVKVEADGTATITNVAMQKTVMYGKGYRSFGSYPETNDTRVLPAVYLQGEKVETPTTPTEPEKPVEGAAWELATTIISGQQYILVVEGQYGAPISTGSSYGRLALTDTNISDGKATAPDAAGITITAVAGKGYTLVDANGRYLGMDESHLTSFQLYTEENEGCYWTAEWAEGTVKLTNVLNPTCIICQSGTYTNIAPAAAPEQFKLPSLYVKTSAGIGAISIETPANGEARYYDLQGRAVSADALTPGLYIRRQGTKAVKVLIR